MTTATRTLPPHGTVSRAKHHRCKCEPCHKADRDYMNTRCRLKAYGRWQPYIDAEPVRAHVRMLMSYGIGLQQVRRLAGISNGGMTKLLYGQQTRGQAPSKRVRAETAAKILAVKPAFGNIAPGRQVDGTGTRRRLQALVATGWPQRELARISGLDRITVNDQVRKQSTTAYAGTARTVRDLYDQLWNVDPVSRGVDPRWADNARQLAERREWPPPAAWDDDTIDSPAARPDLGEDVDRYTAIAEDAQWLMDTQGYTRQQAAQRLGVTGRHLERALTHERRAAEQQAETEAVA